MLSMMSWGGLSDVGALAIMSLPVPIPQVPQKPPIDAEPRGPYQGAVHQDSCSNTTTAGMQLAQLQRVQE